MTARGHPEFTWEQLYQVVRHACATYDQALQTSKHRQRSANRHSFHGVDDDDDDGEYGEPDFPGDDDPSDTYQAFAAAQANAPRLPDEQWNALLREGKAAWYQVPEADRHMLIGHMRPPKPQEQRQANMASRGRQCGGVGR